ncbi:MULTISPECIES: DUF461 domain-containing protein [Streptomyces]|uniref:DUF461 domain-containing protein n=1 Tax=Streptomyces chilikensis TaxID=1194079 RepID=A0ABV3EJ54_9ACTN|nr:MULTISPECIES: DUF461 domain-containing protein [Streptomyces]MDH6226339.1 hypothetical protein [Streptomyces sp. MJP52]
MSSSLRRGALAAAAIAFSIASLAACGAGRDAESLQVRPDLPGAAVGGIKVQNVAILTQEDPEATGPANIMATVFNDGFSDQTLESITLAGGPTVELEPAEGGKVTVPAGGRVVIGGPENTTATLASGREAVRDGDNQRVTFTFSETGRVSVDALVLPAENHFSDWGPGAVPGTATPTAKPSVDPSGKPSGAAASPEENTGESAEGGAGH